MRWNAISTAVPLLVVLGAVASAGEEMQPSVSAANVIERMAQAYRALETYRDTGKVRQVFTGPTGEMVREQHFVTAFVRPDRFRFEITDSVWPNNRYLIWRDGEDVRGFWNIKGVRTFANLDEGVATGAGVTRRASHTVPALLLPEEIGGPHLTEMQDIELLPHEVVDDLDCFVLKGVFRDRPIKIWVDQSTFLIRRLVVPLEHDGHKAELSTKYTPVINESVDDAALRFDPG